MSSPSRNQFGFPARMGEIVARLIMGGLLCTLIPTANGSSPDHLETTAEVPSRLASRTPPSTSFISVDHSPPPGFEVLASKQTTQADFYFGGLFLMSAFVEYDPTHVEIEDPLAVANAIPNLKDPNKVSSVLTGRLPTNARELCTFRKRQNCGELSPDVVGVIYDESRFRLELFVHPSELLVQELAVDKYLPPSEAERSYLHNIRLNAAGSGGRDRFNISSESYIAYKHSRVRARYAISDEQVTLYGLSWQRDEQDYEYEIGSFRSLGRNLAFANDVDVLGFRIATSTKTRQDLDMAGATPLLLFLPERSRVEIYRGNELLSARYYDAGNQEIDTSDFPDGAYEISLKVVEQDGFESSQTHFFVRSHSMPPLNEPQYFFEGGALASILDYKLPRTQGDHWLRAGSSHRLRQDMSVDNEVMYASGTGLLQSGVMWIAPRWHLQASLMHSTNRDSGFSLRGAYRRDEMSLSFDYRQVKAGDEQATLRGFELIRGSYAQGSATLAFPVSRGQIFLRARLNERSSNRDAGLGLSYWGSLYNRGGVTADLTFDSNFSSRQSWVRAGITFRWGQGGNHSSVRPQLQTTRDEYSRYDTGALLDGRWNSEQLYPGIGEVDQSLYAMHNQDRSAVGARFVPSEFANTDLEIGYQRVTDRSGLYYSMNNRFSLAATKGHTSMGSGTNSVGAVIINIEGNLFGQFEVLAGSRVIGRVWARNPNVITLRPYQSYDIRIRPLGDKIVGYDQASQRVTLYPGNVQVLNFSARNITVIISQAIYVDGTPVKRARFLNVEGFGATDELGWFQVEIGHDGPLVLERLLENGDTEFCQISLGEYEIEQSLAVLDPLICEPTPVQQLALNHPNIARLQPGSGTESQP